MNKNMKKEQSGILYSLKEFILADESGHVSPSLGVIGGVFINGNQMKMRIEGYKISIPSDNFEEAKLSELGSVSGKVEILWHSKNIKEK